MKKKTIIITIIAIICIILGIVFLYLHNQALGKEAVAYQEGLVEKQGEFAKTFTSSGYTIDQPNVILNPYEISPLTALITFETEEEVTPTVTIEGKDDHSTYTHTFAKGKEHYLPIYGLYANKKNKVTIQYGNVKKEIAIQTEKLPDNFALPVDVKANKEKLGNDLYFYTPSSIGYTCAYDVNGDVRWYLKTYSLWKIDRLANGHLLVSTERLINAPYYMTGLYEMNLLGQIITEYSLKGGYHHDYFELENGNLLVASDDFNNDQGTVEDYIVELDRQTGDIVRTYDLKDILPSDSGKSENWIEYDWFHNNSVWFDKKTNSITLSGRHQDAVINIDYKTGELNWIIGDPTNWDSDYQKYFFTPVGENFEWQWSQHAAMITPEGYVFILDNGNNKSKDKEKYVPATKSYTRGVMYKIDTDKMTIEQVWQYGKERGSSFYSPYISDVDYLAKNHYIVHSGGISYKDGKVLNQPAGLGGADKLRSITVELLNDDVIFELTLPINTYRVEKMSLYYEKENYERNVNSHSTSLSAKRVGSLGKTEVKKTTFGVIHGYQDIDSKYESHHITFTQEIDRLIVTGQFKKGTDVNIALYKNMMSKVYAYPIAKKPYTALCVDVFTEEENENGIVVTKYINAEGLSGKYSIYLEIEGALYKTNQFVTF